MAARAAHAVTAARMRPATSTLPSAPTSPDDRPPADPGLIPLSVAEVKRLYDLLSRTLHATAHLRWNWWRRCHQARARWYHQRTRLRREAQSSMIKSQSAAAVQGGPLVSPRPPFCARLALIARQGSSVVPD
jgi:hypothetical protein